MVETGCLKGTKMMKNTNCFHFMQITSKNSQFILKKKKKIEFSVFIYHGFTSFTKLL